MSCNVSEIPAANGAVLADPSKGGGCGAAAAVIDQHSSLQ